MSIFGQCRAFGQHLGFGRSLASLAGAALVSSVLSSAVADEVEVRVDGLEEGDNATICPCFVQGEEAAVWLTAPCDGDIVAIQVFWRSFFGGATQTVEDSLIVYSGGNFPVPGPVKDELLAPVMTDGGLNEYRFEDENGTIPISIPVSAGETFVVSFKFFNDSPGLGPSILFDNDGITPNSNAIRTSSGWTSAASLGVTGDWIIRVIVDCQGEQVGSVCLQDGSCVDSVTETEALMLGGVWSGPGSSCADNACVGACSIESTGACLELSKEICDAVAGDWQGPGTTECVDACPADLTGEGALDFADVSAFLTLFAGGDLSVDFDESGSLDFGDVSAFLALFAGGCP